MHPKDEIFNVFQKYKRKGAEFIPQFSFMIYQHRTGVSLSWRYSPVSVALLLFVCVCCGDDANRARKGPAAWVCLQTQSVGMQTFPKPALVNVFLGCFSHHGLVSSHCSVTCFLGVKCYPEFVVWNSLKETPSVMEHPKLQLPEYMNTKEESKVIHEFSRVLFFFLVAFLFPILVFLSRVTGISSVSAREVSGMCWK